MVIYQTSILKQRQLFVCLVLLITFSLVFTCRVMSAEVVAKPPVAESAEGENLTAALNLPSAYLAQSYDTNIYGRMVFADSIAKAAKVYLIAGDISGKYTRLEIQAGNISLSSVEGTTVTSEDRVTEFSASSTLEFSCTRKSIYLYSKGELISQVEVGASLPLRIYRPAEGIKVKVHKTEPIQMTDDFMRKSIGKNDSWDIIAGHWRSLYQKDAAASPNPFICQGNAKEEDGILLAGYPFWNNYSVSVALKPSSYPETGIVFGYRDLNNYFKATLSKTKGKTYVSVIRLDAGEESVLERRELFYPTERWFRFTLNLFEGHPIEVTIDGVQILTAPNSYNLFGKAGLFIGNGYCLFDDFLAISKPEEANGKELLHLAGHRSRAYSKKQRFLEDDRDSRLFRWAKETDAWPFMKVEYDNATYSGRYYRFPFFGQFSFFTKNKSDNTLIVIRDRNDKTLLMQPLPQAEPAMFMRQQDKLYLNGKLLETGPLPNALYAGLYFRKGSSRKDTFPEIRSNSLHHELFENSTVDWYPVGGDWQNTSRWGCAPKWKFFSGSSLNAAIQFSKQTFDGDQIHEINYGLKDIIGDNRVTLESDDWKPRVRRYKRNDVNFSFLTNGKDVFSGYTFIYGGYGNTASYLYRGHKLVATNKKVRFPKNEKWYMHGREQPNVHDQHLFWRRFRFERFGKQIRVLFEDKVVFDYTETEPEMPTGGHLALWTYRNGIVYARLDSAAENIAMDSEMYVLAPVGEEGLPWRVYNPNNVLLENAGAGRVKLTNRFGGGEFAMSYSFPKPIALTKTPKLKLWLDLPKGVAVNLHLNLGKRRIVYALTAPTENTYSILTPDWQPEKLRLRNSWFKFGKKPLAHPLVGGIPQESIQGEITIDLLAELQKRFPGRKNFRLNSMVIGNTSHQDYLMAGLSGNVAGASYSVGIPSFTE